MGAGEGGGVDDDENDGGRGESAASFSKSNKCHLFSDPLVLSMIEDFLYDMHVHNIKW